MSTEIATTEPAALPALYGNGPGQMSAKDIIMPRIETVQGSSNLAKEGVADEGDVVFRYGGDDEDPTYLVGGPDGLESSVMYVLLNEKFAATTASGQIEYHDTPERDMDDPDSWEGWNFYCAVPSIDPFFPAKWMLWRTAGSPAARQINTMLMRARAMGETGPLPVKITVRTKTNKRQQSYKVPVVGPATADPKDLKAAVEMQARMGSLLAAKSTENDGPKAPAQPSIG